MLHKTLLSIFSFQFSQYSQLLLLLILKLSLVMADPKTLLPTVTHPQSSMTMPTIGPPLRAHARVLPLVAPIWPGH